MRFISVFFSKLCFLLLFLPLLAWADDEKIRVSIQGEADSVWIGDHLRLQYRFAADGPFEPQFLPDTLQNLGSFEVLSFEAKQHQTDELYHYDLTLQLINFEAGRQLIPPQYFSFKIEDKQTEVRSPPYPFFIKTPEIQPEEDIKPIKPPLSIPFGWRDLLSYWWAVALLLVIGGLLWLLWYLRKKRKAQPKIKPEVQIAPHEEAYAAIQRLKKEKLWESGNYELFYVKLSQILRQYLERRYEIQATKSVTKEIMAALETHLDEQQQAETAALLQKSDLVKFAKFSANEGYQDLQALHTLVKQTALTPQEKNEEK